MKKQTINLLNTKHTKNTGLHPPNATPKSSTPCDHHNNDNMMTTPMTLHQSCLTSG